MLIFLKKIAWLCLIIASTTLVTACTGTNQKLITSPAPNPYLSAGAPSVTHSDPGASDSQAVKGPTETGKISGERIKRLPAGLVTINYAGLLTYPGSVQAVWNANNNRVAKIRIDDNRWEELATLPIEGMSYMDPAQVNAHLTAFDSAKTIDDLTDYLAQNLPYYAETQAREAGVYTMVDERGDFYVLTRDEVLVYGDKDPTLATSPIILKRRWIIPPNLKRDKEAQALIFKRLSDMDVTLDPKMEQALNNVRDYPLGINMTYDGHIVFSLIGGVVIVLGRDFQQPASYIIVENEILANSLSLDEDGGIYVVGDRNMHKFIWTGDRLSNDPGDGAWSSPYDLTPQPLPGVRGGGTGSGTTPTLMGFGPDEDHLVVIADGLEKMNIVAFWRDDIPENFKQHTDTKSPRIADQMPVTMDGLEARYIQTEVSVAISGQHAFVVNGMALISIKPDLDNLLVQGPFLGPPSGAEMLQWNNKTHKWESLWARKDVSAPAAIIPLISSTSQQAYMIGWSDADLGEEGWNITGFDLETGSVVTRMDLGRSQKFNGAWGQLQLLPDGDVFIPGITGPVRILSKDFAVD